MDLSNNGEIQSLGEGLKPKIQLERLCDLLKKSTKLQQTREQLIKIDNLLNTYVEPEANDVNSLLYDCLKPICRQITNCSLKMPEDIQKMESVLIKIIKMYTLIFRKYQNVNCLQNLRELLSRDTFLFKKKSQIVNVAKQQALTGYEWTYRKYLTTQFYRDCCQAIMVAFNNIYDQFIHMTLNSINEYLNLLYFLNDVVKQQKLAQICDKCIDQIINCISNPSKQFIKQASKQIIDSITEKISKILQFTKNDPVKHKTQLLGAQLGLILLKQVKVERKIAGIKLLTKYSTQFYISPLSYLSDKDFCLWMVKNQIFQYIYQQDIQIWFLKLTDQVFASYIRNRQMNKQLFDRFFTIADTSLENRKHIFRLLAKVYIRIEYHETQIIIEKLQPLKKADYYEQEFFSFFQDFIRFQYNLQISKSFSIISNIIDEYYESWANGVQNRSLSTYVKVYNSLVEKVDGSERKLKQFENIVNKFYAMPSKITLKILKRVIETFSETVNLSKNKIVKLIVSKCQFFPKVAQFIKNNIKLDKQELLDLIKLLLKYSEGQDLMFSSETLLNFVNFPKIFCAIVPFIVSPTQSLKSLLQHAQNRQICFLCVKQMYFELNKSIIKKISYCGIEGHFEIIDDPNNIVYLKDLLSLLQTTPFEKLRQQCAQFIAQLFSCFSQEYLEKGEKVQLNFMNYLMKETLLAYEEYKQLGKQIVNEQDGQKMFGGKMKGLLCLVEEFLGYTEVFGVGKLKSHNSLVATSTILIKINNQITEGSDVLHSFQKKFPSSNTLFEVMVDSSRMFKCSPTQMILRKAQNNQLIPIKFNGLTLDEININGVLLIASKSYQNRLKNVSLFQPNSGTLSPQAIQVFSEIYARFAPDGRMGKRQASNYIEAATNITCTLYDCRIGNLMDYDKDLDGNITLDDFIRFYQHSSTHKPQTVIKNLQALRYRGDLKKYDEPIVDFNPQIMFRHHLCKDHTIYQMLFQIVRQHSNDLQIRATCLRLLLRLPTYPKIINSLNSSLEALGRDEFETQYILIAIQSKLHMTSSARYDTLNELYSQNKYCKILVYVQNLFNKLPVSDSNKKCIIIALHILRSLTFIPNLNQEIEWENINVDLMIELPMTHIFHLILQQSLNNIDVEVYEIILVLLLTQKQSKMDWIKRGIFHKDKDIRKITCNFVLVYQKINKHQINLFEIEQSQQCQQWFGLLCKMVSLNPSLDIQSIFTSKFQKAIKCKQSLSNINHNKIIRGNLQLIKTIIEKKSYKIPLPDQFCKSLINLSYHTISGVNRKLIYDLLSKVNIKSAIQLLRKLIDDTEPSKEVQRRDKYVGIKNLGCTCYMNSILQQFFFIPNFRNLIMVLKTPQVEKSQVNGQIIIDDFLFQLQKLYAHLSLSPKKYYNPTQFCLTNKGPDNKPINTAIQQDAHQFLNKLFNNLETYLKKEMNDKALDQMFGGNMVTMIRCQTCKNQNKRLEQFTHLSVQVKGMDSLKDSLTKLTEEQQISGYHCEVCGSVVPQVTKQSLFNKLPDNLVINLQRIIFDITTLQNVKVSSRHQFPHQLSMKEYLDCDQNQQCTNYQLMGVVIHSGTSLSGHYYSLINLDKEWYKFNDQSVSKFDEKNLAKQAYGGSQDIDQWGQLQYSTNAYILIYRKIKIQQTIEQNSKEIIIPFKEQIEIQSSNFYYQIQIHQQSFFIFINQLFSLVKPEGVDECINIMAYDQNYDKYVNAKIYSDLLKIYLKMMNFMTVYYDLKNQIIVQVSNNIYCLFYLVPEESYQFIQKLDLTKYFDVLLTHNQIYIRELFKVTLNKSMHVYKAYYGYVWKLNQQQYNPNQKMDEVLLMFKKILNEEILKKNNFKSQNFGECLRFVLLLGQDMISFALHYELLGDLLDYVMGPESPFAKLQEKRPQISSPQSLPFLQIIVMLQLHKKGFDGQNPFHASNLQPLTPKQYKILRSIKFYKKMLKDKHDQGILSSVISSLCFENKQFSKDIVQMLIVCLSNTESYQSVVPILLHIKSLLLIEDSLSHQRIKWLLGIPQFQAFNKLEYSVRDICLQSIVYVSNIFFIQSDTYKPLLQRLYEKRFRFDTLTITAITAILQVLNISKKVLDYILALPAPSYNMISYMDWIDTFIQRLSSEDHYGIRQSQKAASVQKLKSLMNKIHEVTKQRDLPILKYIIGKNSKLINIGQINTADYQIKIWEHQTYVIPNHPTGNSNLSVPIQFSQSDLAKYIFYENTHLDDQNQYLKLPSVITLEVNNIKLIKIIINAVNFQHQVFLSVGQIQVNLPYDSKPIGQLIKVQLVSDNHQKEIYKMSEQTITNIQPTEQNTYNNASMGYLPKQFQLITPLEIVCPECTYINYGNQKCQMCDSNLLIK